MERSELELNKSCLYEKLNGELNLFLIYRFFLRRYKLCAETNDRNTMTRDWGKYQVRLSRVCKSHRQIFDHDLLLLGLPCGRSDFYDRFGMAGASAWVDVQLLILDKKIGEITSKNDQELEVLSNSLLGQEENEVIEDLTDLTEPKPLEKETEKQDPPIKYDPEPHHLNPDSEPHNSEPANEDEPNAPDEQSTAKPHPEEPDTDTHYSLPHSTSEAVNYNDQHNPSQQYQPQEKYPQSHPGVSSLKRSHPSPESVTPYRDQTQN